MTPLRGLARRRLRLLSESAEIFQRRSQFLFQGGEELFGSLKRLTCGQDGGHESHRQRHRTEDQGDLPPETHGARLSANVPQKSMNPLTF